MSLLDSSVATTLLGYPILDEGVREHFGRGTSEVEWTIVCRWTDRAGLMFALLGGAALVSGIVVPGSIYAHPLYPWLLAVDVDIEGQPGADGLTVGDGGMIAYRYCRMKVKFGALGSTGDLEYGEERIDYSTRIITAPDGTFFYNKGSGSSAATVPLLGAESPGLIIPRATLQRSILRQPSIPVAIIFALLGHVNGSPFLGGAAETVLFLGCSSERTFSATGNKLWSICYSLIWDRMGWNKFLIPNSGVNAPQRIFDVNNDPPYPLADLTQLGFNS